MSFFGFSLCDVLRPVSALTFFPLMLCGLCQDTTTETVTATETVTTYEHLDPLDPFSPLVAVESYVITTDTVTVPTDCAPPCNIVIKPASTAVLLFTGYQYLTSCSNPQPTAPPPPTLPPIPPGLPPAINPIIPIPNTPIPIIDNFPVVGPDFPDDGCPRHQVNVDGNCESLLTQGSCAAGEWRLLTDDITPQCFPRPCDPGFIFIVTDQLCHDPYDPEICPGDKRIFVSAYGDAVCACPYGYISGDNNLCFLANLAQGSCDSGETLQFTGNGTSSFECGTNSCSQAHGAVSPLRRSLKGNIIFKGVSNHSKESTFQVQLRKISDTNFHNRHHNLVTHSDGSSILFDPNSLNIDSIFGVQHTSQGFFANVEVNGSCHRFGNFNQGPCRENTILVLDLDTADFGCSTLEEAGYIEENDDLRFGDSLAFNEFNKYKVFFTQGNIRRRQGFVAGGISTTPLLNSCPGGNKSGANYKCFSRMSPTIPAGPDARPIRPRSQAPRASRLRCSIGVQNSRSQECVSNANAIPRCPDGTVRFGRNCRGAAISQFG